jgi:hypothetical protein
MNWEQWKATMEQAESPLARLGISMADNPAVVLEKLAYHIVVLQETKVDKP